MISIKNYDQLPSIAWDFYCLFVSLSLCLSPLSLYLSHLFLYLSHSPPLPPLFPDKKFPALGLIPSFKSKFGDFTFI